MPGRSRWDDRYDRPEFVFGTDPNDFLHSSVSSLPRGRALCLGDGEGRNGVFLAEMGFEVTSVDASAVGLAKARRLAASRGVEINTVVSDLSDYDLGAGSWELVVSIFLHLEPEFRRELHSRVARALAPGGAFVLEAYTPRQLHYRTGGPSRPEYLFTADLLRDDFGGLPGMTFAHLAEVERDVSEGHGHSGRAAVVQLIVRRDPTDSQ
jgi:SAM-dependent methyltransferase